MAVGGFFLGLGFALIFGSPNIASLAYGAASVGSSNVTSARDAFSISYWLVWTGVVLFPVGLGILVYGVGAQKSPPETVSTETGVEPTSEST